MARDASTEEMLRIARYNTKHIGRSPSRFKTGCLWVTGVVGFVLMALYLMALIDQKRADERIARERLAIISDRTKYLPASDVAVLYAHQELDADEKLRDKWWAISGIATSFGRDLTDRPYVCLGNVQCVLTPDAAQLAAHFRTGNIMYVSGVCQGKSLFNTIVFTECNIHAPD